MNRGRRGAEPVENSGHRSARIATVACVRWDDMFEDLAGQLERGLDEEAERLRAEEERARIGRLTARDRLLALAQASPEGAVIRVQLHDGRIQRFRPGAHGRDWVSGELVAEGGAGGEALLPEAGIAALVLDRAELRRSLEPRAEPRPGELAERLTLAFALRDLARRRRWVELETASGRHGGTIDRVGRDHLDLAVHEAAAPRREREVAGYRIIPLADLRLVRIAPG